MAILVSVTSPTPQSTTDGGSDEQGNPPAVGAVPGRKSNTGVIVGAIVGSLVAIAILIGIALFLRRRAKARSRRLKFNRCSTVRQHCVDPFTLKHASIFASDSAPPAERAFPSDEKRPIPLDEAEASEPLEASNPTSSPDVSRRPSDASSLAPSETTATVQVQQLQERGEASDVQLASLEERIGSSGISRAEYDAVVGEMTKSRTEMSWISDAQHSDWALGLSDEMPPPYSQSRVNSR
jgi:hypothetical protein